MQNRLRTLAPTLDGIRGEIDRIDEALLDLVSARMSATRRVAALKDTNGDCSLKLRPAREAHVLSRMIARAPDVDPMLIRQLWTSLMAHGLHEQAPMELVLHGGHDRLALQDVVRARFGFAAALRWVDDENDAIAAAVGGGAVAVIARQPTVQDEEAGLVAFDTISVGDEVVYVLGRILPEHRILPEEMR